VGMNTPDSRRSHSKVAGSLADDLDEHALSSAPVELAVKDLFPRPEVQLALRDRHNHFPAQDLPLQMRVGIVLARAIVMIRGDRLVRRQFLEPHLVIVMEPRLIVIDEHRCCYVHRIHQAKPLAHAALAHQVFDRSSDVHESAPIRNLEPEIFG